jgi:hypothetical protein
LEQHVTKGQSKSKPSWDGLTCPVLPVFLEIVRVGLFIIYDFCNDAVSIYLFSRNCLEELRKAMRMFDQDSSTVQSFEANKVAQPDVDLYRPK